jgi:hypothetical protein
VSQLLLFQKKKGQILSFEDQLKLKTILHILERKLYPIQKTITLAQKHNLLTLIRKEEWEILNSEGLKLTEK